MSWSAFARHDVAKKSGKPNCAAVCRYTLVTKTDKFRRFLTQLRRGLCLSGTLRDRANLSRHVGVGHIGSGAFRSPAARVSNLHGAVESHTGPVSVLPHCEIDLMFFSGVEKSVSIFAHRVLCRGEISKHTCTHTRKRKDQQNPPIPNPQTPKPEEDRDVDVNKVVSCCIRIFSIVKNPIR